MKNIKVPKLSFAHFAVIFAVVGIIVLYAISTLSEPPEIGLDEIGEYVGEDVVVKGVVVDRETTVRDDAGLVIYGDNTTLKVVVEDCSKSININDRVRVKGEVREFRGEYELIALNDNSLEVIGTHNVKLISFAELAGYENQYVAIEGVVVDEHIYYDGELYLELFQDNLVVSAYIDKYSEFVETYAQELNITDTVMVSGVVQKSSNGYKLNVLNEGSIELTGRWELSQLSIENLTVQTQLQSQAIARELARNPLEFGYVPVNIMGFVKYEPQFTTYFYISEKPLNGSYSLKIRAEVCAPSELHKGDKVNVTGNLVYDLNSLRYSLEAFEVEVIEPHGIWEVTLQELVGKPYEYLNATLNVTGYVYKLWPDRFFFLVDSIENYSYSLRVYIENENISLPVHDEYIIITAEFVYYERFMCYELVVKDAGELRRCEG